MRRSIVVAVLVTVLTLTALVGAVSVTTTNARAAPFRSFTVGLVSLNVVTYNPMAITLVDEYIVVYNIYSTLLTYDAQYRIHGDLAYNWTLSSDQLTWTFHLVHNAYFTNPSNPTDTSHPVTSDDVLFSYQLNQAETASILHTYTVPITGMSAPDPYTFTVTTAEPFAAIYSTASAISILPKYIWQGINNPVHYSNSAPVGSGAMFYDSANATFGTNMILRRSPLYYGLSYYCQISRPDQVYFKSYPDSTSLLTDFQQGTTGLDAAMGMDPPGYLSLSANSPGNPIQKWAVDTGFVGEMAVNVMPAYMRQLAQFKNGYNNPLLLNYTVRDAIARSIDKAALVKYALLGLGTVADTLVPDSNPWHYSIPANEKYTFDPAAARAELNAAGWKYDSAGNLNPGATPLYQKGTTNSTVYWPLAFRFYSLNTAPEWQVATINITAWLGQAGIQSLTSLNRPGYSLFTVSQLSGKWFTGDYDMWLWDWVFTPASDPSLDVMEVETTMAIGPTSDNFYSNQTFDSTYNQSLSAIDLAARRTLTDTLQKMVYDYRSYILPYYRLDLYAATNGRPPNHNTGWTNFGNWSATPGLVPDSDLPNLWFTTAPVDNMPPVIQAFPAVQYYNTIPTTLQVTASDPESDIANYFWSFGDGTFANTTSASVRHTYAQVGTYQASVRVTDSEWPACESTTVTIAQYVPGQNTPPQVTAFSATLSNGTYGLANMSTRFDLTVSDLENDSIYVQWTFGDSSTGVSFAGPPTYQGVDVDTTHTYTTAGKFQVVAKVTDNQTGGTLSHNLTRFLNVTIQYPSQSQKPTPPVTPEQNPWLNYGIPLIIVVVVVAAVAAVMLRRRKAVKEADKEQERPPPSPPAPPPPT